jgi:hypothetical protein
LGAGIEEAALFAAVQFHLTFGAFSVGIEAGAEDGAAVGAAGTGYRADHARGARAELIGARAALRRPAIVAIAMGFVFFVVFLRVAIPAVTVLSIHKRLRPPVSTDCHNYNLDYCAHALANLACIQSDCYTRPDRAIIP